MDRFDLIEIDLPTAPVAAPVAEIRAVQKLNQHLTDAVPGAIPKTIAEVQSAKALLAPAGLGWAATAYPMVALVDGKQVEVPDRKAIVRGDTGAVIGDVGANFGIVQNEQLAELADAVRGVDGSWTWAQGALRGGSRVFMQLKAPKRTVGGEILQSNLSLFNAFDGSLHFSAGFSDVVIICVNTFQAANRDSKSGMLLRHTSKIGQRIEAATELIKAARKYTDAVDNRILKMMGQRFSMPAMEQLATALVPGDHGRSEKAREALITAYVKAPGAAEGTVWGAFQAVTNYSSHSIGIRKTSGRTEEEARTESNWWGSGAELTADAWGVLTDAEEVEKLQKLVYVRVIRN